MRRLVVMLAVAGVACVKQVPPSDEVLDDAAAAADTRWASARTVALAGWHALVIKGSADEAKAHFERALKTNDTQVWALAGQATLAWRAAQPAVALEAWLRLCEVRPKHPLAVVAARAILESSTMATAMDNAVLERVPTILAKGVPDEVAVLLRGAVANVLLARDDRAKYAATLADMGVPTEVTLVGPFSAWHTLDGTTATPLETTGNLAALGAGPFGALVPRTVRFTDGRLSLAGDAPMGDVSAAVVDFIVPTSADYVVRTSTGFDHALTIDGTPVLQRSSWQRPASTVTARRVTLPKGHHRLVLRLVRQPSSGTVLLAIGRYDGTPAGLTFRPASGPALAWKGLAGTPREVGLSSAQRLHAALVDEAGEAVARFVAARDAMQRDRDGARRLLDDMPPATTGPAVSVLRADVALDDALVAPKVGHGRATRELEAALAKDPGFVHAHLTLARLALDDGRQLDALDVLKTARATSTVASAPRLLLQARVELGLGLDASAAASAREADRALPGLCDALELQYDIARRRDAVADADSLLAATTSCPGALTRAAEHARLRGRTADAIAALTTLLDRDESQVSVATSLASLLVAQGKHPEAIGVLQRIRSVWPRNALVTKALADALDHAGRANDALAMREAALLLDGADLTLRRAVERAKTGKELLDSDAISTAEALKSYEAAPGSEDANATYVLDAAAVRAFPDGSQVDRIHIIQKALDQQGVQEIAEVTIPQGAQVLTLRTLKADGTTLEPEGIEGKETTSLPGVQVGDLIEYEYLQAHPTRGPGQPGFTASSFYFRVARQPNSWSTYVVRAPKGSGLKVDAHQMDVPGPVVQGDEDVFSHAERRVTPYIPEPLSPPSGTEWLPYVTVGSGQTGNEGVIRAYADVSLSNGRISAEVEAFARGAVQNAKGLDAVRAVYAAVHEKLSGRDAGLGLSAAWSVGQDRGSRLWLLKAALSALGFDARVVAVRAFTSDPSTTLFPNEALLPYVCVRVALPENNVVWLDTLVRFAPFGELPEFALGEREAYALPEPGRPLEKLRTPPNVSKPTKTVALSLTLADDGVLSGTGEETYTGFEAAQVAEALDSLSSEQRIQALQQGLSRSFGGADMTDIDVDAPRRVGATMRVKYRFIAKRFGRRDGDTRLVTGPLTFPSLLGRRYVVLGARTTPLFIDGSELTRTSATVQLPKGWVMTEPMAELRRACMHGTYVRKESQQGDVVRIDEEVRIQQARVSPRDYEAFGQFAGEVDLVQGRDVLIEKRR
ncbi:MAG: hypothetical protein JNG84_06200 [Archangium sp.]|nr:hypothetical protein [Archangium sp.]